ncbi:MAG: hypothetical protein Q9170_004497 [Blastenia crenularia]
MADVRSMLRNERANRRVTHPHLTYSSTGTLICIVCHIQIKTEALWNKHLRSAQHVSNSQRLREDASTKAAAATAPAEESANGKSSRKRKADDESPDEDARKRTKGGQRISPTGFQPQTSKRHREPPEASIEPIESKPQDVAVDPTTGDIPSIPLSSTTAQSTTDAPKNPAPIDEDEWAAFQRDVASPPPDTSALTAAADISAAPMSAAELAAQSREQARRQAKETMEAEVEGEKEDAARQLEEEFEDMAELEDRFRKLREKREMLRVRNGGGGREDGVTIEEETRPPDEVVENGDVSEGSSEDDEEDEWGNWGR